MTKVHNKKREVQNNALIAWRDANFRGTLEIATGVGKTYLGVVAACEFIKRNPNERSLIALSEIPHIEHWTNEIKKWGYEKQLPNIDILCHASAHKSTKTYNTIVIDEAHGVFGPKYSKILTFPCNRILLLSATFNRTQKTIIKNLGLPVIFRYTLEQAEKDGVVEKATRYLVKATMTESESKHYKEVDLSLDKLVEKYNCETEENLEFVLRSSANTKTLGIFYALRSKRTKAAECTKAKIEFIEQLLKITNKKVIVQSSTIDFVEAAYEYLYDITTNKRLTRYHSKMTKKKREQQLESFYNTPNGMMLAVQALDQGLDDEDIEIAVICSGTRSRKQKIQREGRSVRIREIKKSPIIINLFSEGTVEYAAIKSSYKGRTVQLIELNSTNEILNIISEIHGTESNNG